MDNTQGDHAGRGVPGLVFTIAALVMALLSIAVRLMAPGWFLIMACAVFVPLMVVHVLVHIRAARRIARVGIWEAALFLVSDLLLLLSSGLMPDFGDTPGWSFGFYSVYHLAAGGGSDTALLPSEGGLSGILLVASLALLAPLVASWVVLWIRSRRASEAKLFPAPIGG